jgi:hypothetical protein
MTENNIPPTKKQRYRWPKGTSGNPNGRPTNTRQSWAGVVRKLTNMTLAELVEYVGPQTRIGRELKKSPPHLTVKEAFIVASIIAFGREPNARMLQTLTDREDGKPAQVVDVTSGGEKIGWAQFIKGSDEP